jgi:DNA-directed RNA polymerase subunit beta'
MIISTIETGAPLTLEVANVVANAMKDWAIEKGATHYTHWFQPLTGKTAEKPGLVAAADERIKEMEEQFQEGLLTQAERHATILEIWTDAKDKIMANNQKVLDKNGPVFAMIDSGARGTYGQLGQVMGMKGLVVSPSGDIIELPIKGNFKEGFDVLEFFISSHGTRKGLSDSALRTANAGYLTRRLVDVSQDVVIVEEDCGDGAGEVFTVEQSKEMGELEEGGHRMRGRVAKQTKYVK